MPFVSVTDRETGKPEPEVGEAPAETRQAQARVGTRARDRMVAVRDAITQRVRARRVATRPVKRVDPYAGVLTDDEPTTSTRYAGWWTTGPQSPAEQWATFRAKLAEADGWMARAWVLLILGSACAVGIAAGGVAWLSQHLGVVAMLGVVAFLWWAVTITGGAP